MCAYTKNPIQVLPIEQFAYSTAQSPLPGPTKTTSAEIVVKRTCAAAQTDQLFSANRALLRITYKNETSSVGALTITPAASETIDNTSSYVLQPGDGVTLINTGTANWAVE